MPEAVRILVTGATGKVGRTFIKRLFASTYLHKSAYVVLSGAECTTFFVHSNGAASWL